jgi:hypothetical protein
VLVGTHAHGQPRVARSAAVVKEAPEGELEEAVERFAKVLLGVSRAAAAAAHFVGVNVVKVGCVGGIVEVRHERRLLRAQSLVKVHIAEIRVRLHLGGVLAEPLVGRRAQLQDQVARLVRHLRLLRDVQVVLPVDHLKQQKLILDSTMHFSIAIIQN